MYYFKHTQKDYSSLSPITRSMGAPSFWEVSFCSRTKVTKADMKMGLFNQIFGKVKLQKYGGPL